MTTTTEPIVRTDQRRRPSARLRFGVAFLAGLLVTLGLGAGALYAYDQQYTGRILPGVRVGSVDLSGLTPDAARTALTGAYGKYSDGRIVLAGPDGTTVITYAEIGRGIDAEGLVAEALAIGRDGSAVDRAVANARTAVRGVDLQPRITFDAGLLAKRVAAVADGLRVDSVESSVATDATLAFRVVAGHPGRTVDATGVATTLVAQVSQLDAPAEIDITLPTQVSEPTVTTAEATAAQVAAERIAASITLVVGDKKVSIDTSKLRPMINFTITVDGSYGPVVDTTKIPTLLDGIAARINQAAVNATFRTTGTKVNAITASKDGYALDVAATAKQIEALLAARALGSASTEIRPAVHVTTTALTTAEARAAAPKMQKISSWTTYFPISDHNAFGANIWIPALTIDGYVVAPHAKFDFWKAVGTVTRAKGYGFGGAIINGHTEPQGALAGGICSCSTTLFNAALRAGYLMEARANHYYYIDRYPLGLDATVFISASGATQTMSWTNDTDYPVLIRGYKIRQGLRGYVRFELYSVPNGRTIHISTPIVKNIRPAVETVQYTTTLPTGVTKRVEYPVDGKQVWRTVTVRDASGKILHSVTYYSNYSRVDGLTLIGK
jgi:vancomycin resistance protein YoaR